MLTFTPSSFANALAAAASTQTNWCTAIKLGLGNSRQMVGLLNGVEFYRAEMVGDIRIAAGAIASLGYTGAISKNIAVNLATGVAEIRIEGDGNVTHASLGLPGSGADYIMDKNPNGTSPLCFSTAALVKPYAFWPSGTGPAAPDIPDDAAVAFRVMDYANESAPVSCGVAYFSHRDKNVTFQKAFMSREYGDVRAMRVPDGGGIVLGTGGDCYKFAGHSYFQHAGSNSEANVPLQAVEMRAKPHGRWASFPYQKDLNITNDTVIPGAFKIELLRADGSIKHVYEMYSTRDANDTPGSGKPINFAGQSVDGSTRIQPFWTCLMTLPWFSHQPKVHSLFEHFVPAVTEQAMNPANGAAFRAVSDVWPVFTAAQTFDGLNFGRVSPKWSKPAGDYTFDTDILDPAFGPGQISRNECTTQRIGHGHEPAASGHHTVYSPPGGSREDRSGWPAAVIRYRTKPNGVRAHGNTPYKEMFYDWHMGYFSHSQHYYTDIERGYGLAKDRIYSGADCYQDCYYRGGSEDYRADLANHGIRLFSAVKQNGSGAVDKNGRRFTNEWTRDVQHNMNATGVGAYCLVSILHAMAARHSFISNVLCAFDLTRDSFDSNQFMTRQHAWYNWHFVHAWICSTADERGLDEVGIEAMWQRHLEVTHDAVWLRYTTGNDSYGNTLRNMGVGSVESSDGTTHYVELNTDSKTCYWIQPIILMVQSGALEVMRGKSVKCAQIIDLVIQCLGKQGIDSLVIGNGRFDYSPGVFTYPEGTDIGQITWDKFTPVNGQMDWIRAPNGSTNLSLDVVNTKHLRAQTITGLKYFLPGYSFPRIDEAFDKLIGSSGWYTLVANGFPTTTDRFNYLLPNLGMFMPPAAVGAPT